MNKHQLRSMGTRSSILEAATASFALHGYDNTSVATLCQNAGVSKGAFYHHFSSKQEVFLELLNNWLGTLDIQLTDFRDEEASVPDSLLSMAGVMKIVLETAQDQLPIYLEFLNKAMRDPQILRLMAEPFQRYREYFQTMIEEGISEGTLQEVDPNVTARLIIAIAIGLLLQGLVDTEDVDWDSVTRESFEILLNGISRR
ncbi:MAG: TetR family transcriptional regulator [Anaerolineales bacterium]|nr:TetR family transcriptional regulator [Anaerolineales bacterium]